MTANKEPLHSVAERVAAGMPQMKPCDNKYHKNVHVTFTGKCRNRCGKSLTKRGGTIPVTAADLMIDKYNDGWGNKHVRALFYREGGLLDCEDVRATCGDGWSDSDCTEAKTPHEAMLRALGALVASREDDDG